MLTADEIAKGTLVWSSRREQQGTTTGGSYACRLEGCTGLRIGVRWPDGSITWPCTKGMRRNDDGSWEIL